MSGLSPPETAGTQDSGHEAQRADRLPNLLFGIDREWRCLQANGAVYSLLGFTEHALRHRSFLNLVHADDRDDVGQLLDDLKQADDVTTFDCRLLRVDGSAVHVAGECSASLCHADRFFLICRPRQRQAASRDVGELIANERRLREILDNTTAVVYAKDLQGRYLFVNSRFERLFGISRTEIRGRTDFDVFPQDMAAAFQENDQRVAESGEVLEIDELAPHEDGPHTYVSVKFPLRNADGSMHAVAGISTDISDRVRAERVADRLRNRLELILTSIKDGIVGLNEAGEVTFANPAATQLLQARASDMAPLLPLAAMEVATQPQSSNALESRIDEARLVCADGTSVPVEYEVQPVVEDGEHRGAVVTFRDVSDRRRREAIERDVHSAQVIQQFLYPKIAPECARFDIAGHVFSADSMCGDYLDFIPEDNDSVIIAVGDVSGHGFGPALQMVETRAYLRGMLRLGVSLVEAVTQLNNILVNDMPQGSFISLFAAHLDPASRTLRFVAAGHCGWLLRADEPPRRLTLPMLVLGIDRDEQYVFSETIGLQTGDIVLVPTDGLQETHNPEKELFGIERMLDTVAEARSSTAREIIDRLYQRAMEFAGPRPQSDDATIAVIKAL